MSKKDRAASRMGAIEWAVVAIIAIAIIACGARFAADRMAEPAPEEAAQAAEEAQERAAQERISSMSAEAREIDAVLANGIWQTGDAQAQAAFHDGKVEVMHATRAEEPIEYAIGTSSSAEESNAYSGVTDVTYTFVLALPAGESIATLTQAQGSSGIDGNWKLSCEGLLSGAVLENQPETGKVEVEGMGSEVEGALGGKEAREKLTAELSDFCTRTFPTAKGCVWDQMVTVNYPEDRAEIRFTVDNRAQTKLLVYYNFADKTINIQEG